MILRIIIAPLLTALVWSVASIAQPVGSYMVQAPVVAASSNSLIFTAASSQSLSATGKTNINQQKFTIAFWLKRATTGNQFIYNAWDGTSNNYINIYFSSGNLLNFQAVTSGGSVANINASTAYTDTSNWHHLAIGVDTTQATAANRVILYLDGSASALGTASYPTQNTNLSNNFADTYYVGYSGTGGSPQYLNAKIAQFYYIDGQQLTPSSFITGTPGVPKTYSGTYTGHFDFFLPFSNGTSTTTLGLDSSGESNNWTLNNMTTANQSSDYP